MVSLEGKQTVGETKLKQKCIPIGCVPPDAVATISCTGSLSGGGGSLFVAVFVNWGFCLEDLGDRDLPPPPVDRMTHTCKNITLPPICLRAVVPCASKDCILAIQPLLHCTQIQLFLKYLKSGETKKLSDSDTDLSSSDLCNDCEPLI